METLLPPDLSPEQVAQRSGIGEPLPGAREHWWNKRALRYMAIGSVGLALSAWAHFNRSGDYEYYAPTEPQPLLIDNMVKVGTWNMHNETALHSNEILATMQKDDLDALMLQEVSHDDLLTLNTTLPTLHKEWVLADGKQQPTQGGYGDVILTWQKPEEVSTTTLAGTGIAESAVSTAKGFVEDIFAGDEAMDKTKAGMQENRAAIAVTIKALNGSELQSVRLITSHISPHKSVHEGQLKGLLNFVGDNTSDKVPTIFCGDLNMDTGPTEAAFGKDYSILESGATSLSGRTIDHCIYNAAGKLGNGVVRVLRNRLTDHFMVEASFAFPDGNTVAYQPK